MKAVTPWRRRVTRNKGPMMSDLVPIWGMLHALWVLIVTLVNETTPDGQQWELGDICR